MEMVVSPVIIIFWIPKTNYGHFLTYCLLSEINQCSHNYIELKLIFEVFKGDSKFLINANTSQGMFTKQTLIRDDKQMFVCVCNHDGDQRLD